MLAENPTSYRPDIDGLRAIAVLPVLFYHARVPGFTGGFVGVDIFFVISGFLITQILIREIDAGEFSLLRFYERRARRILPALFAVTLAVLATSSWLYLPSDFAEVPRSALAALGFVANIYFFTQAGYFQGSAETMPMLHTWSLGVEEQFYIAFPVLLIVIARIAPAWRLRMVILIAMASLFWAVAKQADTDAFAFYMLPTRAWELLAGSLLAAGALPKIRALWLRQIVSILAVGAIIASVHFYSKETMFPGIMALPPVIAAMILIHCAQGTWVGRALSLKGPVAIGLISYSLYLWHWPLMVFAQYAQVAKFSGIQPMIMIAISLVVAWLSTHYIERPFRNSQRISSKAILTSSLAGFLVLGAVSAALIAQDGWSSRFSNQANQFAAATADFSPIRAECINDAIGPDRPACILGATRQPSAIIWGDSHAVELAFVLGEEYKRRDQAILQRSRASCPPVLSYDAPRDPKCTLFNAATMQEIVDNPKITTVYMAGFWAIESYKAARLDAPLTKTMEQLQKIGKRVILIGPVPKQPSHVPRALALLGTDAPTTSREEYEQKAGWFTRNYPQWHAQGISIVDPTVSLFEGDRSIIVANGEALYFDEHHLSLAGARRIVASMEWE